MNRDIFELRQSVLTGAVKTVSFWGAILLPFVYLPMLFMGLDSTEVQLLFLGLITLNVVMIIIGHQYNQE